MSAMERVQHWAWRLYHVDENSKATDVGLLILRVTFAACLFYHHGAEKFYDFHTLVSRPYLDPIGIGLVPSIVYAGFSDGVCSLLVLFGLFSRYASFFILVCLNTVWWLMNNGLRRVFWMKIPAPAGRLGPAAQAGAQRMAQMGAGAGHVAAQGAQHVGQMAAQGTQQLGQMAGPRIPQVIHSLPNYLNVPMYILAFLVIFIAGPGRYSLDKVLQSKNQKKLTVMTAAAGD